MNYDASDQTVRPNFWQRFPLNELTHAEWEALCDGCGTCCLNKFLDDGEDAESVSYTDVACKLLDCRTGYCSNYSQRQKYVPDCISLTPDILPQAMWLPAHCAYKRLYLGQHLPDWHLLITGNIEVTKQGMHQSGIGVAGRCMSEVGMSDEAIEERIVSWVNVK